MPRHQQVTTCRRTNGPISRGCTCEHCNLAICAVCGAYEGGLTTDCPGTRVAFKQQCEVHETCLDYTDSRGWHQGERMENRSPRFLNTRLTPTAPRRDPRATVAPSIDWTKVDQNKALQHELTLRAIDWTLADRECDRLSAALNQVKDAFEEVQTNFQQACRRVEECDDEFRQAARRLVDALLPAGSLEPPNATRVCMQCGATVPNEPPHSAS